ncbi:MAG TPA: hypothetical protein VHF50_04900, partial [Solirubrobacterales bacterium]|nr:hypothetical protein [Solirubrobacterales bacterium]
APAPAGRGRRAERFQRQDALPAVLAALTRQVTAVGDAQRAGELELRESKVLAQGTDSPRKAWRPVF